MELKHIRLMKHMRTIDKFNRFPSKPYNAFDILKNHIVEKYPIIYTDDTNDLSVVNNYYYEFVWLVNKNIKVLDTFPWHLKPKEKDAIHVFPYMNKSQLKVKSWDMVKLVPTAIKTTKVIKQPYICGIYDTYCGKDRYDMFYIGKENNLEYQKLSKKFPEIQLAKDFYEAKEKSTTDFFWFIPDDVLIKDRFRFDYEPDDWSHDYIHIFKNGKKDTSDGVVLFPKNSNPSKKELEYKFYFNCKKVNIIASEPKPYDRFIIDTYEDYLYALKSSTTEQFWAINSSADVENFDFTCVHENIHDKNVAYFNEKDGKKYLNGIFLLSKNLTY